jgi:membrane protease YdiL (CAAX protease family)
MFGPAIANILTRLFTREGKQNLFLHPNFERGRWVHFLAAWVLPGVLTIIGMALFFLVFPRYYDSGLTTLKVQMELAGAGDISPMVIVAMQTLQAILIAPLLNAIPTFGEEFGWRGYLQPKLMPLGGRKAILLTGVIWGVWHWPVIFMGYNYGFDYFGAPVLGPLAMVWFTVVTSALFGWVTIKTDNVWPAVIGHGALNGIAALSLLFIQGEPSTLLGPTPVGLIGGAGFSIAALIIFLLPNALKPKSDGAQPQPLN